MADLNSKEIKFLVEQIDKKIDQKMPTQVPKWFSATIVSTSGGEAIVHLPTDPEGTNISAQNPREISLDVGDEVYIVAINGNLNNGFVDFRKNITLDLIYVDYPTGVDDYLHGTSSAPFKTLQYAISRLPRNLNNRNIVVYYNNPDSTEGLRITNFYGGGMLTIRPWTPLASATVSYIDYIYFFGCVGVEIDMLYLGATNNALTTYRGAIWVRNSSYVVLDHCNVVATSSGMGIAIDDGSRATIRNTEISNRSRAIDVESISWAFSQNNSGSGNTYGLSSYYSSYLGKIGTQPTGTTANEAKDSSSTIQ
jgi:hypothetical protein